MDRVALAFAYDGSSFESFARQPGKRTTEGALVSALVEAGAFADARAARYEVSSRTDARVSALWNVCAFDSAVHPQALVHDARPPFGLWLLSATRVEPGFSPRRQAVSRTYRYSLRGHADLPSDRLRAAAARFEGEHNFQNFRRPDRGLSSHARLNRVRLLGRGRSRWIEFEAPYFLWEQVRRCVTVLLRVGRGETGVRDVDRLLDGGGTARPVSPAPPEPLVLARVDILVEFPAVSRARAQELAVAASGAEHRAAYYAALASSLPTIRR